MLPFPTRKKLSKWVVDIVKSTQILEPVLSVLVDDSSSSVEVVLKLGQNDVVVWTHTHCVDSLSTLCLNHALVELDLRDVLEAHVGSGLQLESSSVASLELCGNKLSNI